MGNQFLILLVVGALLGFGGRGVLSSLNPFKANKVAVVKQESQTEEYFRDKIKGIEYRMTSKNKAQTPVKQTLGQSIGSFIDKSIKVIIAFFILGVLLFFFTGINIFKHVRRLKGLLVRKDKALRQTISGIQEAKIKMNGEGKILVEKLRDKQDEDTKLLIKEIKLGKTDEK